MAFRNKKIEEFQVRKGDANCSIGDPRNYHNITIRARRLRDEDMGGALRAAECGDDPAAYLGTTEFYAVIDLAGEPAEVTGKTIEEVKAQVVRLLREGPKCEWEDKIFIKVEWIPDAEKLKEAHLKFGGVVSSYAHDSLVLPGSQGQDRHGRLLGQGWRRQYLITSEAR